MNLTDWERHASGWGSGASLASGLNRAASLSVLVLAIILSGCSTGQTRSASPQAADKLPTMDLRATVTVLDDQTGEPIPDAWVLVVARVTTDRPAPSGQLEAAAGARGITGPQGTTSIDQVEGTCYPGEPKGPAWEIMEQSRAQRLGPRKLTGIQGGSLVIASAKYGFAHQPFVVEDDPSYQDWLTKNRRENYNGWLGKETMLNQLPLLSVGSKNLREGIALTVRMRRPASLDEWASSISPSVFWGSTWLGMAKDAGATEDQQRRIYWLFAQQVDQIGLKSGRKEHFTSLAAYLREESQRLYFGHGFAAFGQPGFIQTWLAQKALEILPQDSTEVKEHAGLILKGVEEEGRDPRWQNHFLDPVDPTKGLTGFDSAVNWAGLDQDNAKNEWDWQDAQRYYREGDRQKAYLALGHVLRLLANLAIPKYTAAEATARTAFEEAVEGAVAANGNTLPSDYWRAVRGPAFALTPSARFLAMAEGHGTAGQGAAGGKGAAVLSDALNAMGRADQDLLVTAKIIFPRAIAQGAGLLSDFHRRMHPAAMVQLPGNGNGNGGPQGVQQSSGAAASATDATGGLERFKDATAVFQEDHRAMSPQPRVVGFGRNEDGGRALLIENGTKTRLQILDKEDRTLLDYTLKHGWIALSPTGKYALIAEWLEKGLEVEVLTGSGMRLWKKVIPGQPSFAVSDGGILFDPGEVGGDWLSLILPDGSTRAIPSRSLFNSFSWSPKGNALLIAFEVKPILQCHSAQGEMAYELDLSRIYGRADLGRIAVWNDCSSVVAVKPRDKMLHPEMLSISPTGSILRRVKIDNEDLGGIHAANSAANPDFAYFNDSRFVHVCDRETLRCLKSFEMPAGDAIVSIQMGRRAADLAVVSWREELRGTPDITRIVRLIHDGKLMNDFHPARIGARYLQEFRPHFDFSDDALQIPDGLGIKKIHAAAK